MIYLASSSPRRRSLLQQINISYQQITVTVDETPYPQETPDHYVQRLAITKAQTAQSQIPTPHPILAADTIVTYQGHLLGKPETPQAAHHMLTQLSGRSHQVMTAVAILTPHTQKVQLSTSTVHFRTLGEQEITHYIATNEPFDKAGSYAIQGIASIFIQHIEGSYSGIMGLPLYETALLLRDIGIPVL